MQAMKKQEWTEFSWRNNVYKAKFIVETGVEYDCAIEYTYFYGLHTIVTIKGYKAL